ncbi:hypothetical protein ACEUZ9_000446 [Paracoccus litorisediminis]|uniref:hypothetical protein n=1 Tax=Paracoccus litorisediminis TaxID=2006130 RepID=UPI003733745B
MIDAIIIVMLIASITYSVILHMKLNKFYVVLREFAPAIQQFSDAVDRSENSVKELKATSSGLNQAKAPAPASDPVSTFFRLARMGGRS